MTDAPRLRTYTVKLTWAFYDADALSADEARKKVREYNAFARYHPSITASLQHWRDEELDDAAVAEPGETAVQGVRSTITVTQMYEVRAPTESTAKAVVTSAFRADPDEGQDPYRYLKHEHVSARWMPT